MGLPFRLLALASGALGGIQRLVLLNEDFTEPWYSKPETIEAFQFVRDMIWEHEVIPAGSFNFREAFVAGTLGMMIDSPAGRQRLIPAGMTADEYDVNFFPTKAARMSWARNGARTVTGSPKTRRIPNWLGRWSNIW